jgi:hypothetical protein
MRLRQRRPEDARLLAGMNRVVGVNDADVRSRSDESLEDALRRLGYRPLADRRRVWLRPGV